jgi:hypothetical protein
VPDFMLRGIDGELAERIKTIARDRKWALNDVILHLLRQALGLTEEDISSRGMRGDIATLGGTWAADEAAAFRAALEAFEGLPAEELPLDNLKKPLR